MPSSINSRYSGNFQTNYSFRCYLCHYQFYMKQKITSTATKIFFDKGVRSVTLDDLCSDIGISKKTLYQHFTNKEELIRYVIRSFMKKTVEEIYFLMEGAPNSIEAFWGIASHVYLMMSKISPKLIMEVKKYYPEMWTDVQNLKRMSIENMAFQNLKRGMSEGLYRSDINPDMVMRFYLTILLNMNDEEIFPMASTDPAEIYRIFINYHIRSIATPKGYAMFEKLKNKEVAISAGNKPG